MRSTYTSTCFLTTKAQRLFKQYKLLTNIEVLSFVSPMFDVLYTSEYADINSNTMFQVKHFKIYYSCERIGKDLSRRIFYPYTSNIANLFRVTTHWSNVAINFLQELLQRVK